MLFNSPVFLFVFLPVAYLVFWALNGMLLGLARARTRPPPGEPGPR